MKSRIWKRTIALWLAIVMVLTSGMSVFATDGATPCATCNKEECECSQPSPASEEAEEEKKEPEEKPVEEPKEEEVEQPVEQPTEKDPADNPPATPPVENPEGTPEGTPGEGEEIVEEEVPEITAYDYKSDIVNVLVTLTDPADLPDDAVLSVEPIEVSEAMEEKIVEDAYYEEGLVISEIKAFDIKFLVDGKEIQPGNTVKVTVTLPKVEMKEDAVVYHVNENNKLENMNGGLEKNDNVVFETNHFSDYIVAIGDEINEGKFSGYGLLGGAPRVSDDVLEYDKTAKVDNWDDRTYDIEIEAKSVLQEKSVTLSDGMLVVDMSGSMRYEGGYNSSNVKIAPYSKVGIFNDVVEDLKSEKVYILSKKSGVSYSDEAELYTLAYFNDPENAGWYYYEAGCAKDAAASKPTVPGNYEPSLWKKVEGTAATWYVHNWDSARLTQMKEVVMKYMNTVAEKSPLSYFGISSYYHKGDLIHEYSPVVENKNVDSDVLKEFLAMRAQSQWCTYPHLGLEIAFKQMVSDKAYYDETTKTVVVPENSYNSCYQRKVAGQTVGQYVVLFTDGYPDHLTGGTSADKELARLAEVWSDAFEAAGVKVYTVSFCVDNDTAEFFEKVASEGCNKRGKDQEDLEEIFAEIRQNEQVTVPEFVEVDVKDYIDPRFEIVDENGNKVENGSTYTSEGYDGETKEYVTKTGKVYTDDNGQYIIWEDQKAKKDGSSWTVKVKAKEDYLGGNAVPTNIDDISEIDAGKYGEFDLPDPTVNVKATLEIGDNNAVIYKGTATPTAADFLTMYYDAKAEINKYVAPGYADVKEDMFSLQWYTSPDFTEDSKVEFADIIGTSETRLGNETNYYLKFTFKPNGATDDSNANTTKDGTTYISGRDDLNPKDEFVEAVNASDPNNKKSYGTYNIKLWQIVKYGTPDDDVEDIPTDDTTAEVTEGEELVNTKNVLADAQFTLTTTDAEGEENIAYYAKSDANGFVALYKDATFDTPATDTPVGTFTLTETVAPAGYTLSTETWTIETTLEEGVENISSSTGIDIEQEDDEEKAAAGVIASYIFRNYRTPFDLPNAGGMGTTLFTVVGCTIMLAAAFLFFRGRRKED